ncbi:MAG: protein kinase [Planctomycetia bacterium]|nr:protein kinase [Planctomycetia bacterium]
MSARPVGELSKTSVSGAIAARPAPTIEHIRLTVPQHAGEATLPAQIGKYRIVQLLGRGSQATVYRGVHLELSSRDVVIKWANAELPPELQKSILAEGKILAELDDPGLVKVYDVDFAEGRPYIVFEYVAGRTLYDEAHGTTIVPARAVSIVADLAHTLESAHRRGVLHRDLKPANVLIDSQDRVRVLDFGLGTSSSIWTEARATESGISGTLPYMAPEQAAGLESTLGPWTDVFGLGAILYELLTGRPPHDVGACALSRAFEVVKLGQIAPPRSIRADIPPELEAIVLRALAKSPADRFANAGQLEGALRNYLQRPKLKRRTAAVVSLMLVATVAAVAWLVRPDATGQSVAAVPAVSPVADAVPPRLAGELKVRVWSTAGNTKRGISIADPNALPVRNGEQVHLEVSLNRAAYLYLVWIDSEGKVTRLDDVGPGGATPRSELHSPAKLDQGWEMVGAPGLETIVLLAAEQRPEDGLDLAKLIGTLPATGPAAGDGFVAFDIDRTRAAASSLDVVVTDATAGTRGPGSIQTIDDPVIQSLERLRERFDLVKAVRFAHR